jgi:hypothetical protein
VWDEYVNGFGPVAATYAALPQERRAGFRDEFEALHRRYETTLGIGIPRPALLLRGIRL